MQVHLDEWVAPEIADEHGLVRAGKILEWMDVVGALAAVRHCRRTVATASVDGMELRDPIRVGERVTMTASVAYTSARSLGVSIAMKHGMSVQAAQRQALTAYMTFVALDDDGHALAVPQLRPETPADVTRFREGELRREFRTRLAAGQLPTLAEATAVAGHQGRGALVRELLKVLPPSLRLPFEWVDALEPRRRNVSYVHKIEPVRSSKLNFHGTLYGGTLMRWLETTAHLSARAYLDGVPMRMVGLHGLNFIRPVRQHVFIHIRSAVAHTAGESLTVLVNVDAEAPLAGHHEETLRAFLTYRPIDPRVRVPPLECDSDDERTLFDEVAHRLALQRSIGRDSEEPGS
jgi:acyl-CoA hydrolase